MDESMLMVVNEGLIVYVFPYEWVHFEQLGEECVGVTIERKHASMSSENMSSSHQLSEVVHLNEQQ